MKYHLNKTMYRSPTLYHFILSEIIDKSNEKSPSAKDWKRILMKRVNLTAWIEEQTQKERRPLIPDDVMPNRAEFLLFRRRDPYVAVCLEVDNAFPYSKETRNSVSGAARGQIRGLGINSASFVSSECSYT